MRFFTLVFVTFFLGACYRVSTVPKDNRPLRFNVFASLSPYYTDGNLSDSTVTFNVRNGDTLQVFFTFSVTTGNPENYPIAFYIDTLPKGFSITKDSFVFKLNYTVSSTLHISADTGFYIIDVKTDVPTVGLRQYSICVHVMRGGLPFDYATCAAGIWHSEGCSGAGNCTTSISSIPGMPNWVSIRNICCLGDSIIVNALIGANGIVIPPQNSHGYTIYGRYNEFPCGYQYLAISIPDTIVHNGDTTACILFLKIF